MSKFAAFYMFSYVDSASALQRLRRLRVINPDVTFIPVVGVRQFLYLPMVVDANMFGSSTNLRLIGPISHLINSIALSTSGVFRLSNAINKKVGALTSRNKLIELRNKVQQEGLQTLHADFTPIILYNGDHAIMDWFNTSGKLLDFDYLIFYEFDIYTTKPLDAIYGMYTKSYDACFKDYGKATQSWHFFNYPPGCNRKTRKWLRKRKLPTTLYRSLFGGSMISRSALERLRELKIDFSGEPFCTAEMRLPTVLTAVGFRCGKLRFPFYRYRPIWSEEEIRSIEDGGIFHPVKTLTSEEKKYKSAQENQSLSSRAPSNSTTIQSGGINQQIVVTKWRAMRGGK